jgi:hypothetical protein
MKLLEEGANKKALRGFAKFLAVFIILSVSIFGDTMYAIQMQKIFAGNGLLVLFCYIGAFTSVLAVGYLLLGKSAVFEPGGQMIMSWIAFAVEMVIIALNILVVFNHDKTGPMATWALISPATPVVHMLLIGLVYFMDPELKEAHRDKEMQSRIRQAQRNQRIATEMARLAVQEKHLEFTVRELETAINSDESQRRISQHAHSMNDDLLTEMSGRTMPKEDKDDIYNARNERYFGRNR